MMLIINAALGSIATEISVRFLYNKIVGRLVD